MSEELVEYFIPQFFCNYSPENPNFLVAQAEKARPLRAKKSLKPLSVDAFRFNQQALIKPATTIGTQTFYGGKNG
ncbi:MAG: hypothetical protein QNJ74_25090 [Trichodesmium sp. MO_231.B1]|nr:hypothetical protein [Trichodesmium sp. MO_231.B1]